jgi:hypothetical protein
MLFNPLVFVFLFIDECMPYILKNAKTEKYHVFQFLAFGQKFLAKLTCCGKSCASYLIKREVKTFQVMND